MTLILSWRVSGSGICALVMQGTVYSSLHLLHWKYDLVSPICHWYVFVLSRSSSELNKLFIIMHFDVLPHLSLYLWAFVFLPFLFMPHSVIHPLQVSFCLCFFLCQAFLSRAWICCLVFSFPQASAHGSYQVDLKNSLFSIPDLEFVLYCHCFWSGGNSSLSLLKFSITLDE